MKKWDRSHLRDQISLAILDSAPKEVAQVLAQVGTGGDHLFRKVRMAKIGHVVEKSTCSRSHVDILLSS